MTQRPESDVPMPVAASPAAHLSAKRGALRIVPVLLAVVVGFLVLSPLVMLVISSLRPTGLPGDAGFTLAHYADVYASSRTYVLLGKSLEFAVGSAVLAVLFGTALAWLTERSDMPFKRTARVLVLIPMATPPVLLAISWVLLLSPKIGLINTLIRNITGADISLNIYSMPGMIFVQALAMVPTVYLIMYPSLRSMDASLEEAALTSGMAPWKVITSVVLPLVRPAIVAAFAFLTIIGFVSFDIPGILGLPRGIFVLSSEIYFQANPPIGLPDYGAISALAASFVVLLLGLSWIYRRETRRASRFITVTGKGTRSRPFRLGPWRWAAAGLVGLYALLSVIAPLGMLLWTSLLPYYSGVSGTMLHELTLRNHRAFWSSSSTLSAFGHSAEVALLSATVVVVLSVLVSWVVVRSRIRGRRLLDVVAFVPLAVPSTIIGVALIFVYLTITAVPLYGTVWIIALAYITVYLSFGTRVINSAFLQLHPELEEAGRTSGAGWVTVFRSVTLPLVRPAMTAVWIWVAAHALRELSTALILQSGRNNVLPTLVWDFWQAGRPTVAAAAGVWLVLILGLLIGLWQLVGTRHGAGEVG